MKSFDSRTYSINDFMEWERNQQLELSPRFQRNSVWSDNARSYLMDTIVRGKPIPKVFLRQKINATTRMSIREVVDGQQRLRTIISYLKDSFYIHPKHNKEQGGKFFSQLDEEVQVSILNYEVAADLLVNMSDEEVLDVFGRLNSYAVVLNDQERIHANHFGPFKLLADNVGQNAFNFWVKNKILTDAQVMRMGNVALAADLLIAMIEGIKSKKQLKKYYEDYESDFQHDVEDLKSKFNATLATTGAIFGGELGRTEFRRVHIFYSLFTAIYHLSFGLKEIDMPKAPDVEWNFDKIRLTLNPVDELFGDEDRVTFTKEQKQFLEDSRRATTDAKVRLRRTRYLVSLILKSF
ncbi:GmrSD restriction endonuclease domain-containing protein [Hymenobacter ruricola]|uniref:DUF262 domain-containing protein n=1 Tax=Hymenobacter ruricola TaxID=2791023 RepID=A0ABS0HY94_9BACT|nr:DUF262 domain-containing protein [Hymenobacter ruricola]MBF9219678.1 DUF262 domain-containing protein [Hymenobacter ruricola]